jgi:glycosyltransferase 2 family protein
MTAAPALASRRTAWRIAQVALLGLVAVGVYRAVAGSLEGVSITELLRWPVRLERLALSLALLLSVYITHAGLWRKIMSDLDIARPSAATTVRVYFMASLGRYLPGRLWALAGLAVLSQRAGIPPAPAAAAAVIGQVAFLSTGLLLLAAALPGWAEPLTLWFAGGALVGGAAAAWLIFGSDAGHGLRLRLLNIIGNGRAGQQLGLALQLVERVRPAKAAVWAAAYGMSWVVLAAAFTLFVAAFVPGAGSEFRQLGGTVAASYLVGYIAIFSPGGIVVREGAMAALLSDIMPLPAAIVVAVASRLWFTAAELLPLLAVPIISSAPTPP